MKETRAEGAWRWICRGLAVVGALVAYRANLDVPGGAYILLLGLFFGPDVFNKLPK